MPVMFNGKKDLFGLLILGFLPVIFLLCFGAATFFFHNLFVAVVFAFLLFLLVVFSIYRITTKKS